MATAEPIAAREVGRRDQTPKERGRIGGLGIYTFVVIAYLFFPIAVMALFGFNATTSRFNFAWQGFTLDWYRPQNLFAFEELNIALRNSLFIATVSTVVATALGTLVALAISRYDFKGRSGMNTFLFLPMATPEIAMGVSLLAMFVTAGVGRGTTTIIIAHIMFSISYVVVTIRARTQGLDTNLEAAAQDLGAGPWTTFRTVTFPMIFPGVLAAGLLAFVLSIDDFVITSFNAGSTSTMPLWVYGASRIGVPPQVNVLGTLIFMIGVVYAVIAIIRGRRAG